MKRTLMCMIFIILILLGCGQSRLPDDMAGQVRQGVVQVPRIPDTVAAATPTPTAPTTITPTTVAYVSLAESEVVALPTLPPGGLVRTTLETNRESEARPVMYISSPIVDKATGRPVKADVYVFEDVGDHPAKNPYAVQPGVERIEFGLEQSMAGSWLVVVAPGFERWAQRVDFRIEYSRVYEGRVELVREGV